MSDEISKEYKQLNKLFKRRKVWGEKDDRNKICQECFENIAKKGYYLIGPSAPWIIGKYWDEISPKILFVGKVLEVGDDITKNELYEDVNHSLGLCNYRVHPWSAGYRIPIQGLIEEMKKLNMFNLDYNPEKKKEYEELVSITNLVKCGACKKNKKVKVNIVQNNFGHNCISELGLIKEEIKLLKPDVVVFLTSDFCDDLLEEAFFKKTEWRDIKSKKHRKKKYFWVNQNNGILYLGCFHPVRKSKEFIKEQNTFIINSIKKFFPAKQ